jgi:hypothetical protein
VAASRPSLLELAREARAAVRARPGIVLAVVVAACLAVLALHAVAPAYTGRAEVSFTSPSPKLVRGLENPARVLTSGPVLSDLERELRRAGLEESARGVSDRLTVLQPDDPLRVQLVAVAGSRRDAGRVADAWARSFLRIRTRQVVTAFAAARRRLAARLTSARAGERRDLRARLLTFRALESNLSGGKVVSPASVTGPALVPWPVPLVGLALGIALAAGLGLRDGRVRTRSLLRTLGGPPLIGTGLLGVRIAALDRGRMVLSPVEGAAGPATAVARALDGDDLLAGLPASVVGADEARRGVGGDDAWLLVVPLGLLTREELAQRFIELAGGSRPPDGMVAVEERLALFRRLRRPARHP